MLPSWACSKPVNFYLISENVDFIFFMLDFFCKIIFKLTSEVLLIYLETICFFLGLFLSVITQDQTSYNSRTNFCLQWRQCPLWIISDEVQSFSLWFVEMWNVSCLVQLQELFLLLFSGNSLTSLRSFSHIHALISAQLRSWGDSLQNSVVVSLCSSSLSFILPWEV